MTLIIHKPGHSDKPSYVSVTEQKDTVRLLVIDSAGSERAVQLTLPEARKLAEHLNLICQRIKRRPGGHP